MRGCVSYSNYTLPPTPQQSLCRSLEWKPMSGNELFLTDLMVKPLCGVQICGTLFQCLPKEKSVIYYYFTFSIFAIGSFGSE